MYLQVMLYETGKIKSQKNFDDAYDVIICAKNKLSIDFSIPLQNIW